MIKVPVLNVMIDMVTMDEAVAAADAFAAQATPRLIATANAEMVMLAQRDEELARILEAADLVVPDGAGVVWAARRQGYAMKERVAGYDLTQRLLAVAARKKYRVFFFGGAPGVAETARVKAARRFPGLDVAGVRDGYFSAADEPAIIQAIQQCRPAILLVALGVPKQEKWIDRYRDVLGVPLTIGVGGTFDVMAGAVRRAPLWMQKANLEWLFRLAKQPWRIGRMMALPKFVLKVAGAKKH